MQLSLYFYTDIDECAELRHNCAGMAMCENEVGSFRCTCPTGYMFNETATACNGQFNIVNSNTCISIILQNSSSHSVIVIMGWWIKNTVLCHIYPLNIL